MYTIINLEKIGVMIMYKAYKFRLYPKNYLDRNYNVAINITFERVKMHMNELGQTKERTTVGLPKFTSVILYMIKIGEEMKWRLIIKKNIKNFTCLKISLVLLKYLK